MWLRYQIPDTARGGGGGGPSPPMSFRVRLRLWLLTLLNFALILGGEALHKGPAAAAARACLSKKSRSLAAASAALVRGARALLEESDAGRQLPPSSMSGRWKRSGSDRSASTSARHRHEQLGVATRALSFSLWHTHYDVY